MATRIELTSEQRQEIETARKKNRDKTVERRFLVLLMRCEGKKLKEIAEATGYHYMQASNIISKYAKNGLDSVMKMHYQGNRRNMSYEEEEALLAPFKAKAGKGQLVEIREIAQAYQNAVDHKVGDFQIYRILARHGWRKIMPRSKHPQSASPEAVEASKKLTKL